MRWKTSDVKTQDGLRIIRYRAGRFGFVISGGRERSISLRFRWDR